ncbi:MAG: hypothetical protein KIC80_06760 [Brachyspira sp.]|nr:hypothetical protein [Brachyspira sp.]
MRKYFYFFIFIIFLFQHTKVQAQDAVIHETLQINPNIEMLMSHEYYNGIHVKSIKVKQVEVEKDNYIKNGEVIEGEPNCFAIIIEITDMKGKTIELLGILPLSQGDYAFKLKE